jgi:hypothetical protein
MTDDVGFSRMSRTIEDDVLRNDRVYFRVEYTVPKASDFTHRVQHPSLVNSSLLSFLFKIDCDTNIND